MKSSNCVVVPGFFSDFDCRLIIDLLKDEKSEISGSDPYGQVVQFSIPKNNYWVWLYEKLHDLVKEKLLILGESNTFFPQPIRAYWFDTNRCTNWGRGFGKYAVLIQLNAPEAHKGGCVELCDSLWSGEAPKDFNALGSVLIVNTDELQYRISTITEGNKYFAIWHL